MFLKKAWLIAFFSLFVCCAPAANNEPATIQPGNGSPSPVQPEETSRSFSSAFDQSAETYLHLRPTPGQFSGGAWNEAVDAWDGEKHAAMQTVAAELDRRPLTVAQLTTHLGEPDQTLSPSDAMFTDLLATHPTDSKSAVQILVYQWRGSHDFLYLLSDGERVTAVGWWYAGE